MSDRDLVEWGLVRVVVTNQVTLHAVGIRVFHPHEESRIVVTSPVRAISEGRDVLVTQNNTYDLVREISQFPFDLLTHHVWLLALKGIQPDRIDWLHPDGSTFHSMERDELAKVVAAEAEKRRRQTS